MEQKTERQHSSYESNKLNNIQMVQEKSIQQRDIVTLTILFY